MAEIVIGEVGRHFFEAKISEKNHQTKNYRKITILKYMEKWAQAFFL